MPKRQIFISFHYQNDNWRVQQVRNMWTVDGNPPASPNEWEEVKRKGKESIKNWINNAMRYRSCIVVLVGSETSRREWVHYEIERAWKEGKGIVAVHIHGLKDKEGKQSYKGDNPLSLFMIDKTCNYIDKRKNAIDSNEISLASVCKCYDTPYISSEYVYDYIKNNIEDWIEEAIEIRNKYPK